LTPVQAPNANAFAERWVGTVRAERLDWLLIVGRRHLEKVLRVYIEHYNVHRPHRALRLGSPDPPAGSDAIHEAREGRVHRYDLLGGAPPRVPASCMNEFPHPHGLARSSSTSRAPAIALTLSRVRGLRRAGRSP